MSPAARIISNSHERIPECLPISSETTALTMEASSFFMVRLIRDCYIGAGVLEASIPISFVMHLTAPGER